MEIKLSLEQKQQIKKQIADCKICTSEYKGWVFDTKDGERIVRPCSCTILKKVEAPVQSLSMPYKDHD